jgi:fructokinase
MPKKKVVCFGEVLWDLLPSGKVAGGAPMNVAYHLNNFGIPTKIISKVGKDGWGSELLDFLWEKGVPTELIQRDARHPTGIVNVKMEDGGHPHYEIVENVAWDFIELKSEALKAVEESDLLVFGSLAARNQTSKNTLLQLLSSAKFKVFDINLRPPYYRQELLEQLLTQSDIVKMNHEELAIVAKWYIKSKEEATQLDFVKEKFKLTGIILTKGADGAVFLDDDGRHQQSGFPVDVEDTIGSGDSFLAGFLSRYLRGASPLDCLAFAGATGALVATHRGATPHITEKMVNTFITNARV